MTSTETRSFNKSIPASCDHRRCAPTAVVDGSVPNLRGLALVDGRMLNQRAEVNALRNSAK